MLSADQLNRLIKENEDLQAQVEELNMILSVREQELELMKKNPGEAAELRSMLDVHLDEFQAMQNQIGEKQRQVEGAAERELELEQELTGAAEFVQLYNELLQEYASSQAQLNDTQAQLLELDRRNRQLQEIAGRIGEVESKLYNSISERDELKERVALLEGIPGKLNSDAKE